METLIEIFHSQIDKITAEILGQYHISNQYATPLDEAYLIVFQRGYEDMLLDNEPPEWLGIYPEYFEPYMMGLDAAYKFISNRDLVSQIQKTNTLNRVI